MDSRDAAPFSSFPPDPFASPFHFDGVIAVPRQCGHNVHAMPESVEFVNKLGHDVTRRRCIWGEVRTDDCDIHVNENLEVEQFAVNTKLGGRGVLTRKVRGSAKARLDQSASVFRAEQLLHSAGPRIYVPWDSYASVSYCFGNSSILTCNYRAAASHSFNNRLPKSFVPRWEHQTERLAV